MTGVNPHAAQRVQRVPHLWLAYFAFGVVSLIVYYLVPDEQQAQDGAGRVQTE